MKDFKHIAAKILVESLLKKPIEESKQIIHFINFYEVIEKWRDAGPIGDLDDFPGPKELKELIINFGYVRTWIENARGISFTCWEWTDKAKELIKNELQFDPVIDPSEEYV